MCFSSRVRALVAGTKMLLAQNCEFCSPSRSVSRANGRIRWIVSPRNGCSIQLRGEIPAQFVAYSLSLSRKASKARMFTSRGSISGRRKYITNVQCLRLKLYFSTPTQTARTKNRSRVAREIRWRRAKIGNSKQSCFHFLMKWSEHLLFRC